MKNVHEEDLKADDVCHYDIHQDSLGLIAFIH